MKIGIITDIHASFTSSIMPIHKEGSIYTTRLQMVIDSIKWSQNLFKEKGVDLVVNIGDLFDNHIVRAEELTAVSEAYYSTDIDEIYVLGNHETLDVNRKFHSSSILENFDHVTVVSHPSVINYKGYNLSILPYMSPDMIKPDVLNNIKGNILFSHIDIRGSHLRPDYTAEFGVEPEMLSMYFNHVFNGHIHTAERILPEKGYDIRNVGSLTSTSFSDSNEYVPSAHIYDTDTNEFVSYQNPYAILFRRFSANSIKEVIDKLERYNNQFKYILRVTVPYDIREETSKIVESKSNVITSRIISDISKENKDFKNLEITESINSVKSDNIKVEFLNFLKYDYEEVNQEILKYPYEQYLEVISGVGGSNENNS